MGRSALEQRKDMMVLWMLLLWTSLPVVTGETHMDSQASCSTTCNDLVFIMDGSSSLAKADFQLAKQWIVNITHSFDVSSQHTQVGVVQYSDTPRLEIPLGKHLSSKELVEAIHSIGYLGGNTQTGRAIKFATQHVFPSSNRTQAAKNRIAVVLTDGRSQDDVVDAALEAKSQNIMVFAVGVGSEITKSELVSMANSPLNTYVLYAEDYASIGNIRDAMEQKLCEESVCPLQNADPSLTYRGFDLLSTMKIDLKAKKIEGSLVSEAAYVLSPRLDFTENTRVLFPEGLPPSYVFITTLRLKTIINKMKFDLMRVLSKDGIRQYAVTLNGADKSVMFSTMSINKKEQNVIFNDRGIKRLFDTEWHQLKLLVRPRRVTCYLDDMKIEEQLLDSVAAMYIDGETQVAKKVKMDVTIPLELQKLRFYCDPEQSEKETACEIYSVDDVRCPVERQPVADSCNCPVGKPGLPGLPGPMGFRGEKGREGPPGPDGKPAKPGVAGIAGEPGKNGHNGEAGEPGVKGEPGLNGAKGEVGSPGTPGPPGPPGPMGPGFEKLQMRNQDKAGAEGQPGSPGNDGAPGPVGAKGETGASGEPGAEGPTGVPGLRGLPGPMGLVGPQGKIGLPGSSSVTGPPGPQGPLGVTGPAGAAGEQGPKGNAGPRGLDGFPGLPGLKGDTGHTGAMGLPGNRGLPGFKGDKGEAGSSGAKGNQGNKGNDGEPGTPGTAGGAGIRGSKGEKGVMGDPGVRGADGKKGETGQSGALGSRGFPGQDGMPGQPGVPGYPGKPGKPPTEDQLMKICANVLRNELPQLLQMVSPPNRGECGRCEGVAGPPGELGPPGADGSRGPPGYPGQTGQSGYPGEPGRMGVPGLKGDIGPRGLKGAKGDGDTGSPGAPGPQGMQGPRGRDGDGHPGPPGASGRAGSPGGPGKRGPPGVTGVCDPASCYQPYGRHPHEQYNKGPSY